MVMNLMSNPNSGMVIDKTNMERGLHAQAQAKECSARFQELLQIRPTAAA